MRSLAIKVLSTLALLAVLGSHPEPVSSAPDTVQQTGSSVSRLDTQSTSLSARAAAESAVGYPERFVSTELAVFPVGTGTGQIGVVRGPHGEPPVGPSSLALSADGGSLFVLDSVGNRVLKLSLDGRLQDEKSLPENAWGMDLAAGPGGTLYVLDARSPRVLAYRPGEAEVSTVAAPGDLQAEKVDLAHGQELTITGWRSRAVGQPAERAIVTLSSSEAGTLQLGAARAVQSDLLVTRQGLRSVSLTQATARSGRMTVRDETGEVLLEASVETETPLAWTRFLDSDKRGNSYVIVTALVPDDTGLLLFGSRLDKYSPKGTLLASAPLPAQEYSQPVRPFVAADDGTLYQLVPGRDTVRIVRWRTVAGAIAAATPPAVAPPRPAPLAEDLRQSDSALDSEQALSPNPITRDQIMATAQSYSNHTWTVGSSNYPARTCSNGCAVGPAAWPAGSQITGVAYKWGGWNTVADFDSKLSQGYLAGAVTGTECVGNCAAGVDCSGYVQQTWNIVDTKHNVAQLISSDWSEQITWEQLQRGDALGRSDSDVRHIVLFAGRDDQGQLLVYESVWGTIYKVRYGYAAESLSGYQARRRLNTSDDTCSPNADQIALYVDANYGGQCVVKGTGDFANPAAIGLPDDSISSVRVGGNVRVKLCRGDNYGGTCEDLSGDDSNLSDNSIGNDQVSSAKVESTPTSSDLIQLYAVPLGAAIQIAWETSQEIDNLGFNLYRAESPAGPMARRNDALIPTRVPPGSPFGAAYEWLDQDGLVPGQTYYYWLEEVGADANGHTALHGPVQATAGAGEAIYLPLVER